MSHLPIHLELKNRLCLVIGGGEVAARRAAALASHEADVVVIAPKLCLKLSSMHQSGLVQWNPSAYDTRYIDGAFLAVAATNDDAVNEQVSRDAAVAHVLVCRADSSSEGDFIFPGVVERGSLTISVSTGGGSPTLAAVLLERIGDEYGPEWSKIVELCKTIRDDVKLTGQNADCRKAAIRRILADTKMLELLTDGKFEEAEARAKECLLLS